MDARIMRQSLLFLAPLVGLLVTGAGCAREGYCDARFDGPRAGWHRGDRAVDGVLGAVVLATDIAQAVGNSGWDPDNPQHEWTTEDGSPSDDDGDAQRLLGQPVTFHTVPASADPPPPDKTRAFDLGGAYGEMARVDVDACKADGLATGYGRVVLGFDEDGAPAGVSIEMPAGSSPEARACVDEAFRKVRVAPFDGAAVNVRRVFYVKS
jgi:hypothetical protein